MSRYYFFLMFILIFFSKCFNSTENIPANKVLPSAKQFEYQQMETIGFIHFTINTFTNKEWGFGDENPSVFNPTRLDVEQWVITAKNAGLKELLLTAKHHDGFCLWPSKYTEHSIKNSPYKNGRGDIVREFVDACKKHNIKAGLYLSPWDRNHKDYGNPQYINYYRNQLRELLSNYGSINEIWFDGANGGDGFYGGAYETRKIDNKTYYQWDSTFALVKELQPDIMIFSDAGPDVHWIGNEKGFAGETFWSTINQNKLIIGASDTKYLNTGDPNGTHWIVGQCDVSIRPGWFYHQHEDSLVKTANQLVDIYYKSVGRNAVLLLNLPPDHRGLIHENDVAALNEFKQIIDETFSNNMASKAKAIAKNSVRNFEVKNILDNNIETYWASQQQALPVEISLSFKNEIEFDRIMLQEPVHLGQRISEFKVDALVNGQWETLYQGTTIGYKRLLRTKQTKSKQVKLVVTKANNNVALSSFGIYQSSEKEYN
ncbi:MAG: alpha-L-fucosidase [Prolixibacteraceae bacterium]|nr:alpha-L-fucosidase [Prolixibacteraceae bacterium]